LRKRPAERRKGVSCFLSHVGASSWEQAGDGQA
jgi:hypothetical protein